MKPERAQFNTIVRGAWLLAGALALFGAGQAAAVAPAPATSSTAGATARGLYRPGQKWIVPGEWEFSIDAARPAKVRIHPQGGGSWVPTQVLLLSYSYKNIGFDDSASVKGGGPSTLAFSKAHLDVVDANDADNGGVGNYPVHLQLVQDADGRKVGQAMAGAQWPYAFKKKPRTLRVTVSHYDSRLQLHAATFIVPVEATRTSTPHAKQHVHRT
ncbi:hypothetical protein [Xanthomonas sp. 3075]|uniref:hypothetical protein n=1 Tax=Xanthomonas sp. 3075 TaxID=3035315 RepID=UPI0017AA448D|nr:hypothetical protein [Xanthomonas sp. 3075]MBB4131425.1 hypothetical protein [Xanthomonas sp. 3075]